MTAWPKAAAVAAVLVLLAAPAAAADPVPSERLCTFHDEEVHEASGLVDRGEVLYTTNDSGDGPILYTVDAHTCSVVAETTYADDVSDVEALAPGNGGTVWTGDIGDNLEKRSSVAIYSVEPARHGSHEEQADAFTLTYPDGPHNAETLLVNPADDRVYVVTKSVFGGEVYVAPATLHDGDNRLRRFAQVPGLITDGTFTPDGRHVVLRTYTSASVYTFPAFGLVGTVQLPKEKQGESVSVGRDGRVLVTSEGVDADVLRVSLPGPLADIVEGRTPRAPMPSSVTTTEPTTGPATGTAGATETDEGRFRFRGGPVVAVAALLVAGLGFLAVRGSRLRGPRKR